jgi:hypothetical protein
LPGDRCGTAFADLLTGGRGGDDDQQGTGEHRGSVRHGYPATRSGTAIEGMAGGETIPKEVMRERCAWEAPFQQVQLAARALSNFARSCASIKTRRPGRSPGGMLRAPFGVLATRAIEETFSSFPTSYLVST